MQVKMIRNSSVKPFFRLNILSIVLLVTAWNLNAQEAAEIKSTPDSLEYDIIVTDIGFDSYLAMQPSINHYSEHYYKTWNKQYVLEWNYRFTTGVNPELYENHINYNSETDYGTELEYKLYHYFQFFEKQNNVTLIPRKGK